MARFDDYAQAYQSYSYGTAPGHPADHLSYQWWPSAMGELPHREFGQAFRDVAADPENQVVIMTGTGEAFSGPRATPDRRLRRTASDWDRTYWEGKQLLLNLLDIEVPMISAINGLALRIPKSALVRYCPGH